MDESAEQPNDVLQEDVSVDTPAWPTETDGQLEGKAEYRLPALTEESMLLRIQEIEVRATPIDSQHGT